jgi:phenylalanyl-tRNA synthetase beta chain
VKVTYNWLNDFVDIKLSPQLLAEKLTMAGLEVKGIEEKTGDFVFEIEITSNRPDWLSVIGVAREIAAVTGSKLKTHNPKLTTLKQKEDASLKIVVEDKKDCPLYTAKIIRNVKVAPSPDWLRKRLELVGCRSVNNIVDITNYVLFEYGEPLHAFDLNKLSANEIMVRRAKKEEKITTIDGQQLNLNPEILLIADKARPVAVAGIMGGKDTEVSFATKNILLEAAIFNPVLVRRGKRSLGLDSESAYRFERGIAPEVVEQASLRAAELIAELAGGKLSAAKSAGSVKTKAREIQLSALAPKKILGKDIPSTKIKKILEGLGFKVKSKAKGFVVKEPAHRPDINTEIDLIEEIARIYGYENVPTTLAAVKPKVDMAGTRDMVSLVKNILVGLGLNEAITYSLVDKDLLRDFGEASGAIEVLNPISRDQEILRPKIIPSLCRCVAYNLNQKQDYVNIFEIAAAFSGGGAAPKEELRLAISLCGARSFLLAQGLIREEAGLLHLKGIIETLFERLGIKDFDFENEAGGVAISVKQEKIGLMLELPKNTLDKLDIKNKKLFALEVSLEKIISCAQLKKEFSAPARYPGITRDISFILKENIPVKEILTAIQEGGALLREVKIADYYKGKQIPAGFKGLTISCLYRSDERTLTEEEINPMHASACKILTDRFNAQIR